MRRTFLIRRRAVNKTKHNNKCIWRDNKHEFDFIILFDHIDISALQLYGLYVVDVYLWVMYTCFACYNMVYMYLLNM